MPTTRTRIKRAIRSRVTEEARAIFAEALKLQVTHDDCSRGAGACRSTALNQRCADCARYFDLRQELSSLLGTKPWETCPLDAVREDPPDWLRKNHQQCEFWRKAWAQRSELERD
jgi:hypothetical protein